MLHHRKWLWMYYKMTSKTTTLPYFVFERWRSQDVILESWCSVTTWKVYIKRSPLRSWSNILARILHWEPSSFSCLVNLDEVGGVLTMSTDAAHQWLLLQLQTLCQIIRAKPWVTTREIQERLNSRTAVTMSILYDHPCVRQRQQADSPLVDRRTTRG